MDYNLKSSYLIKNNLKKETEKPIIANISQQERNVYNLESYVKKINIHISHFVLPNNNFTSQIS